MAMSDRRHVRQFYQDAWPESFAMFQIGFLVEDLRAAARKWVDVFGVGPFYFLRRATQQHIYRGRTRKVEIELCVSQAGPVQIELIQLFSDGPNIYRDMFPTGGGLHQLCTVTRDYDATKQHYEERGYPVATEIGSGAVRVCYFDTSKDFGFVTELVEHTSGFIDTVGKISDVCATWDGEDPLRYMTRDGYRAL
jgi:hypothetical protein